MAATWFQVRRDGSIAAPTEVWGYLGRKATQMVRHDRQSGLRVDLLLEFIQAAAEAQQAQLAHDTVVPHAEPVKVAPARLEMTAKEAAERMGCSERYIRRLCSDGRIQSRRVGRDWIIRADDIDRQKPRRTT